MTLTEAELKERYAQFLDYCTCEFIYMDEDGEVHMPMIHHKLKRVEVEEDE